MRLTILCGTSVLALCGLAGPARAQATGDAPPPAASETQPSADGTITAQTESRLVYTPADFAQYAPRSALDMLQQVPGFTIQETFGQGRGLGEATGNVLLNSERISSKSDSVSQRLGRIAAADVIRIELVDGATLDIPGLTGRVANIVARASADLAGQFEWTPQLATDYASTRWAGGRISVTGAAGPLAYTVAAENSPFHGGTGGPNTIYFAGGLVEERFNQTHSVSHNPRLSTQVRIDGPGGSVGNLSASFQRTWSNSSEDERVLPVAGLSAPFEEIRSHDEGYNYEFGGDVEFAAGPGRLKLIALESYRETDFATQAVIDPDDGQARRGSRFTQISRSGERIGRAEYSWNALGGDWQLSAEAAFNRLNNRAGLLVLAPTGVFRPVPFPAGTGGVTEDRYETILSFGRPVTTDLSLQVSLGGEYSKLSQTGASARSRAFKRPKGALTLAWAAGDGLDISFKAARRVGQRTFGDFLAAVNLQNDNASAGNSELRPQQSWEFELEAAQDLGRWGSVTASLFDNRIEDLVTVIPLPIGGEAVGNLAAARLYGVQANATVRFDPIGFRGAKLDVDLQIRKSRLLDPVTGTARPYFFQPSNINFDLRHDVPGSDWAWGVGFRTQEFELYYRTAEFGFDYSQRNQLRAFVEHKNVFGLTVQVRINNLLEQDSILHRVVFAGRRDSTAALFREYRRRELGRIVNFTVKGNI